VIEIPLTQGKVALIDDCDAHLAKFGWYALRNGTRWCAARTVHGTDGRRSTVRLSRVILGATDPAVEVRHVNGDGLDCRRDNLFALDHGDPLRFWVNVRKGAGCWEWTGVLDAGGYGQISIHDHSRRTHRVSWELNRGPIPGGLWVLHHCDNRKCVRPDHLYLGNAKDNARDMVQRGRHPSFQRKRRSVEAA
jgi:hypothetical protein